MKKELELSDIAGYLPYGLNVRYLDRIGYIIGFEHNVLRLEYDTDHTFFGCGANIEHCKPILRPMTDLVKPMTHPNINNGEEFVPIMELVKLLWDKKWVLETEVTSEEFINTPFYYHLGISKIYVRFYKNQLVSYDDKGLLSFHGLTLPMIDLLNKLHLDYNNLIGQGLAIDINTLK